MPKLYKKVMKKTAWSDYPVRVIKVISNSKQQNRYLSSQRKKELKDELNLYLKNDFFDVKEKTEIVNETTQEHLTKKKELKAYLLKKYKVCTSCQSEANLTIEHRIPVDILKKLGLTRSQSIDIKYKRMFTILCRDCNNEKGNSFDLTNKDNNNLLIWLIKKLSTPFF